MQIIDGYCDVPNIYADDIGEYNISLFGAGDYVLAVGEKLGYELISNNELRIKDGIFLTQGRRGIIKKGSSELCIIENGTQAEKRNDLVVIEYARDEATQVESHRLKVLKGTPGEDAADPEAVTGDISSGAVLHQMPLYRVRLDGLNVVAVEPLFEIGNVSPETVDPVTATEEGFAADAKLTGDALRDLSANLFIVKAYNVTVSSTNQWGTGNVNVYLEGYTPIGIVGFSSNTTVDNFIYSATLSGNRVTVGLNNIEKYNIDGAKAIVNVLFIKKI